MKTNFTIFLISIFMFTISTEAQQIHELWSVPGNGTYVLIGSNNMDNDPQKELVYLEHVIGPVNFNSRIIIFDGLDGAVDYDSGPGVQDHFNVAGFNWTTTTGSNINTGMHALFDTDLDGMYELVYNKNGDINEVLGYDGNSIVVKWSVSSLDTYVLIGAENMDNDPQPELLFLQHVIGAVNYNKRFVIFDGLDGSVDYDSGTGGLIILMLQDLTGPQLLALISIQG